MAVAPMTVDPADAPVQEHRRATVRPDKAEAVTELADAFRTASAAVLTEYRGLSVKQLTDLRRALGQDTDYAIVKNSLTSIAARDAGLAGLDDLLTGPTAVAFVGGDPVEAARCLRDFARNHPLLVVKGGVMDGRALTAEQVRELADLESREVLLGKLAGAMLASLSQAVHLLNAPLAQVARLAAALQDKAAQDPSVIGGAGTASADLVQAAVDAEAGADPAPVADAEAGAEPAPVADAEAGADPAAAADAQTSGTGTDSTHTSSTDTDSSSSPTPA